MPAHDNEKEQPMTGISEQAAKAAAWDALVAQNRVLEAQAALDAAKAAAGSGDPDPAATRDAEGLTLEDVRAMTPEQALARFDEVEAVVKGLGQ